MRLVLSVLAAAAIASPALAALAPEYYQRARDTAPDVVVFKVEDVTAARPADGYGQCIVAGVVEKVERGSNYRKGGPIEVKVPCMWPHAEPLAGAVIWQSPDQLMNSRRGRAWLERPGELALYQYEVIR